MLFADAVPTGQQRFQNLSKRIGHLLTLMEPVRASQKLVGELFDHYFEHLDLPGRWGEAARAAPDLSARARIISDFIAGMTDPYAIEQHGQVVGG